MKVTRFAPSPTGFLHIGGLRTALFSWLSARANSGKFLLRIEDTDMARNSEQATEAILNAFDWLGISYDDQVEYQSKRQHIYSTYIDQLLSEGKAYKCYMSKDELEKLKKDQKAKGLQTRYDGRYRDFKGIPPVGVEPVIRLKAPLDGRIKFTDGVKGNMDIAASEVDDFVIARSDGTPTYNFVVVVDDALMGMTDVIRGDDHLTNTPKQIVIYEALGFDTPNFHHVAMINNEVGEKYSKRNGAMDVMEYKRLGYLPEALLNFLVRLGWSHGDKEIFSVDEMIELFDPNNINKSASCYNPDKLLWLNSHYIKNMPNDKLADLLVDFKIDIRNHDKRDLILDSVKDRGKTLVEIADLIELIFLTPTKYDEKAVKKAFKEGSKDILRDFATMLTGWEGDLETPADYHKVMEKLVEVNDIGFGKLGMPLRVSLLGSPNGPALDAVMALNGVDETLLRIEKSLNLID